MRKKFLLLLLVAMTGVVLVACKKKTTATSPTTKEELSFTVTYVGVKVTEVEPTEEGGSSTYTYEEITIGTEKVVEGQMITGVAVSSDGTKFFADKYYTVKEVNLKDAALYVKAAIHADLTLYAENSAYAVYQELASGDGYTLNYPTTQFPTTWNPHIYETNDDSTILGYSSTGFYEFDYNETKDGYKWVDGIAVGDPVDVTSTYATEQWGIAEGDTARAWEITLRSDLCWDDGTAITSADFVSSAIRLLNPLAKNSRADDYTYGGNLVIHNAKEYLLQGSHAYPNPMISLSFGDDEYVTMENLVLGTDGVYYKGAQADNHDIGFSLYETVSWTNNKNTLQDYYKYGYITGTAAESYKLLETAQGDKDYISMTPDYVQALRQIIVALNGYESIADYEAKKGAYSFIEWEEFCFIGSDYAAMSFDKVGIIATAPNKIVYVIDQELSGFYLKYSLSTYLVKTDVYDACDNITFANASDNIGSLPAGEAYRSTYSTDATNSPSYGPYKLAQYQLDKYFKVVKNTNWWGYKDAANKGLYQTTAVVYTMATSASTRLQMFLSGQFDSYGLSSDDMDEYGTSDYTYYTDGDSTWFIALNPSQEKYKAGEYEGGDVTGTHLNIDKEILSIKEFRQALSFALNRAEYELACDPTGNVAKALLSSMIISNPEEGTVYRNTDAAKQAVVQFWGVQDQIGEGKLYATIDAAIDAITGYNLSMAKAFFNTAYDKAVELGYIDDNDVVSITIGTPNLTLNYYNKGYDFLVSCYTDAVKGTKLEGKLTFKRDGTLGNAFGDALRNHKVDMLFGVGWTGSALDPYGLIEVYTTYDNRYALDTDYSKVIVSLSLPVAVVEGIEGSTEYATYTANVADLTAALNGTKITLTKGEGKDAPVFEVAFGTTVDYGTRGLVLAAIELAVLNQYEMIPIAYDSSAAMKSMKVEYYTEEYIYGVGRGGIKYLKFNYNDSQWAAYVKAQGGKLNYKASAE